MFSLRNYIIYIYFGKGVMFRVPPRKSIIFIYVCRLPQWDFRIPADCCENVNDTRRLLLPGPGLNSEHCSIVARIGRNVFTFLMFLYLQVTCRCDLTYPNDRQHTMWTRNGEKIGHDYTRKCSKHACPFQQLLV